MRVEGGRFFVLHAEAVHLLFQLYSSTIASSPPQETVQCESGIQPHTFSCSIQARMPPHDDSFTFTSGPWASKKKSVFAARGEVCRHLLLQWNRLSHAHRELLVNVATPPWQKFNQAETAVQLCSGRASPHQPRAGHGRPAALLRPAQEEEVKQRLTVPAFTPPALLTHPWTERVGEGRLLGERVVRFHVHELHPQQSPSTPRLVLLTVQPLPSFQGCRAIQLHLPGRTGPVPHWWSHVGEVDLTVAQLSMAQHWMAKTLRPVLGMQPVAWQDSAPAAVAGPSASGAADRAAAPPGQRRYLLLPLTLQPSVSAGTESYNTREEMDAWCRLQRILPPKQPKGERMPAFELEVPLRSSEASLPVDWQLMHRCLSSVLSPLTAEHFDSDQCGITRHVLVTLHDGALYTATGIAPPASAPPVQQDEEGQRSPSARPANGLRKLGLAVPTDVPLITAMPYSHMAYDLKAPQSAEQQHEDAPASSVVLLSPPLLYVHPVPLPLLRLLRCVPSYMYGLECHLLTMAFLDKVQLPRGRFFVPLHRALVARGVLEQRVERDRLTFLGQLYDRLRRVTAAFCEYPNFTPSELSPLASTLEAVLRKAAERLQPYVRWSPFSNRTPIAGLESDRLDQVTAGSLGDSAAAVIGACMVHGGQREIEAVLTFLGLPVLVPPAPSDDVDRTALPRAAQAFLTSSVPRLEAFLGYRFTSPTLLLHAFTHPSASMGFSLERLEHLGDSVLNFLIGLAVSRSTEQSTQQSQRDSHFLCKETWRLRSNRCLGLLAEEFGLQQLVLYGKEIMDDVRVRGKKPRKVEEVLEAMVGAVYVDAGMRLEATQRVWEHIVNMQLHQGEGGADSQLHMRAIAHIARATATPPASTTDQPAPLQQQQQQRSGQTEEAAKPSARPSTAVVQSQLPERPRTPQIQPTT